MLIVGLPNDPKSGLDQCYKKTLLMDLQFLDVSMRPATLIHHSG